MTNDAFVAGNGFKVPDGTYVFPFLSSNDALSGLPLGESGEVLYDDALVINESWEELEALGWEPPGLPSADVANHGRVAALDRIRSRASG